ncbi:uncharacterized protein LOC118644632 isoform X2 [Monomorium pharaonis]|uniref:uncharacterized protein LOC118644632 isoform X2 n=1 Tax=Monomorium pharaonis TaxID=307658 RepID=UPI001746A1E3|nr:uncharacterized protein LOC118644632 isoform X2 [Monomorium pharaonis]
MSNGSGSFDDTAIHGKLEPPRSLHGVEDAEVIWDTITRRFPNAAPLLCEMETVIERAEDLLQQLRTPCAQENDTSSSFHTPDSRESNATISMVSDIESFAEETNSTEYCEATENVEAQFTVHDSHEKPADLESRRCSEQSIQREKKHPCQGYHLNSPPTVDEVVQHFKTSSMNKCHNSQGESGTNVKDNADKAIGVSSEERLMKAVTKTSSLEGWMKMTDDVLQERPEDVKVSDDNNVETRPGVDGNADNHSSVVDDDDEYGKTDEKKVSVVKCSATTVNNRSPLDILEEYAKRCKASVKYKYKPKSNMYVMNGDLCGFRVWIMCQQCRVPRPQIRPKTNWQQKYCGS